MSSDNDKCFQCQEMDHMACYCPHIRCFDCDNYGHVAVDCPSKIPLSGVPARCRDNNTSRHDRSSSQSDNHNRHYHHDHRDRNRFSRSQSIPIILDTGVTAAVTLKEVALDHFTDPHATAHHATEA